MATVSKEIADAVIAANGQYKGDEPVVKVVEYDNAYGGKGYGLVYAHDDPDKYRATEWVRNPKTIWACTLPSAPPRKR